MASLLSASCLCAIPAAWGQTVKDGSDAAIGKADTKTVLALIKGHIDKADDAKVTELRRVKGSIICGSVNVKAADGRYLGARGFVVDVAELTFGRLPEGVELLDPRVKGYNEKEKVRELYFDNCMD